MTARRALPTLAWSLLGLWVLVTVLFVLQSRHQPIADEWVLVVPLVGYAVVGALVAARQPGNAVGWLLLTFPLVMALSAMSARPYVIHTRSNPGYVAVAWVAGWLFNVWLALVVAFLPLIFPDGRLLSPRWRPCGGSCRPASSWASSRWASSPGSWPSPPADREPVGGARAGLIGARRARA